jgi:hypothetical protein
MTSPALYTCCSWGEALDVIQWVPSLAISYSYLQKFQLLLKCFLPLAENQYDLWVPHIKSIFYTPAYVGNVKKVNNNYILKPYTNNTRLKRLKKCVWYGLDMLISSILSSFL